MCATGYGIFLIHSCIYLVLYSNLTVAKARAGIEKLVHNAGSVIVIVN